MWIFTQDGFVSAVDNGMVPGKLAVRARDKESLALLAELTGADAAAMRTSLEVSIQSHLMAFAAEESRRTGRTVTLAV